MAGGTFTLTGTLVNSGAESATPNGAATLSLCAAVDADSKYISFASGVGFSYVVRVDTSTNSWVLVGVQGGTYSFSGLPAGFTILTAQLNYGGTGSSATNFYGGSDSYVNANANANVEFDALTTRALIRASGKVSPASPFPDSRFPGHGALSLNNNGYGFRFNNPGTAVSFQLDLLTITGTYDIVTFSWTLPVTTNIKAGDKFTINGDSKLDGVSKIHVQYYDSNNVLHDSPVAAQDFIFQSPTQLIFYFPEFGNLASSSTVYIYADGNGVQFSGTVLAGTVTITFADASGIYVLVPLKGTDTIYNPSARGTTTDVNIQDPFIETAFLP